MEVTTSCRPSTFCLGTRRRRNFYTEPRKTCGQTFSRAYKSHRRRGFCRAMRNATQPVARPLPTSLTSKSVPRDAKQRVGCFRKCRMTPFAATRWFQNHSGRYRMEYETRVLYKFRESWPKSDSAVAEPGSGPLLTFERLSNQVAPSRRLQCCVGRWRFSSSHW
jgi:hypothetical protein